MYFISTYKKINVNLAKSYYIVFNYCTARNFHFIIKMGCFAAPIERTGDIVDGKLNGKGSKKQKYDTWEGQFVNDKLCGEGKKNL